MEQRRLHPPRHHAEGLAGLKPAFDKDGTVTAGTSSPLTDGAAAVLVCSEEYADAHGLEPLARVKSVAVAGCAPEIMGIGPVAATARRWSGPGIEVGRARRGRTERGLRQPGARLRARTGLDAETVNIDGGAIALGHPLGATGARIIGKAATLLKREGGRYALATPMHRRRPGHRHRPGARLMADDPQGRRHRRRRDGRGIAAQVANAGVPVVLLDIVPRGRGEPQRDRRRRGRASC